MGLVRVAQNEMRGLDLVSTGVRGFGMMVGMNSTAVDFEICPGLTELALQLASVGRSRRSIENTRTRKRLGRAIRNALAPITAQNRRFVGTWSRLHEPDLRAEFPALPDDLRVFLNLGHPGEP